MKTSILSAFLLSSSLALSSAPAALILTNSSSTDVANTAFDLTVFPRNSIETLPISASQQGGSYLVNAGVNGVGVVASGTAANPAFALTITNNTGATLTSINFAGSVFQLKGNTGNIGETLTASVVGLTLADPTVLNINTVVNSSGINNPPATAPYNVALSGISLANGQSFTVTWTDANDAGTDAFFGLSNLRLQATPVPEPGVTALLVLGAGAWWLRRRHTKA